MVNELARPVWYFPFVDDLGRATLEMQRTFNELFDEIDDFRNAQTEASEATAQQIADLQTQHAETAAALSEAQELIAELQAALTALDERVTGFHP